MLIKLYLYLRRELHPVSLLYRDTGRNFLLKDTYHIWGTQIAWLLIIANLKHVMCVDIWSVWERQASQWDASKMHHNGKVRQL